MNSLNSLTSAVDPTAPALSPSLLLGLSHLKVALLGDSITLRTTLGSGTIAIGRPRIWHKAAGRLS